MKLLYNIIVTLIHSHICYHICLQNLTVNRIIINVVYLFCMYSNCYSLFEWKLIVISEFGEQIVIKSLTYLIVHLLCCNTAFQ